MADHARSTAGLYCEGSCAFVLSGAVGQGAFEAGALRYLTEHGYTPRALIGTSSGALNALGLAHGILRGAAAEAAENLAEAWVDEASIWKLFFNSLSPADILARRGLLNQRGLYRLMRSWAPPLPNAAAAPQLRLSVVVAPLKGERLVVRGTPHRTYEHVEHFTPSDFSDDRIERMYEFVAASAAFPGLFAPVQITPLGPCIDGGAVNNAAISIVEEVSDTIFLISAFPADAPAENCPRGFELVMQLVNVLIQERLVRDLATIPLTRRVIEIRPTVRLPGNGLSALWHRRERAELVAAGYARAQEVVARLDLASVSRVALDRSR